MEEAKKLHVAGVVLESHKTEYDDSASKSQHSSVLVDKRSKRRPVPPTPDSANTANQYSSGSAGRNPVVCSPEIENACLEAIIATIPDTDKFLRDKKLFSGGISNGRSSVDDSSTGRIQNREFYFFSTYVSRANN